MTPETDAVTFNFIRSIRLLHSGDAALLGLDDARRLYTEEYFGEDGLLAQAAWSDTGELLRCVDESQADGQPIQALELPEGSLLKPGRGWNTVRLNHAGARHRGLRETDRIADTTLSLSVPEKMLLAAYIPQAGSPMSLIGIAESYVMSEAQLTRTVYLVCRRLRIAYALPGRVMADDGLPCDYETAVLHVVHLVDLADDKPVPAEDWFGLLPAPTLYRPTECIVDRERGELWIAESGDGTRPAQAHLYRIDGLPRPLSHEEALFDKLYRS